MSASDSPSFRAGWTPLREATLSCKHCGDTPHVRQGVGLTRLLVHAGLCVISLGAWLPAAALDLVRGRGNWGCTQCERSRGWFGRYDRPAVFPVPALDPVNRWLGAYGLALLAAMAVFVGYRKLESLRTPVAPAVRALPAKNVTAQAPRAAAPAPVPQASVPAPAPIPPNPAPVAVPPDLRGSGLSALTRPKVLQAPEPPPKARPEPVFKPAPLPRTATFPGARSTTSPGTGSASGSRPAPVTVLPNFPVCATSEALKAFQQAFGRNDEKALKALTAAQCANTSRVMGYPIEVVSRRDGLAALQVDIPGGRRVLWVPAAAVVATPTLGASPGQAAR